MKLEDSRSYKAVLTSERFRSSFLVMVPIENISFIVSVENETKQNSLDVI